MSLKKLLGFGAGNRVAETPVLHTMPREKTAKARGLEYEDLINAEAELGRTLFGPVPAGRQREFFKHRGDVWIWHESWTDELGQLQNITIRYEVRPDGVFKKIPGSPYAKIEGEELKNFCQSAKNYLELVKTKLYC